MKMLHNYKSFRVLTRTVAYHHVFASLCGRLVLVLLWSQKFFQLQIIFDLQSLKKYDAVQFLNDQRSIIHMFSRFISISHASAFNLNIRKT